MSYIPADLLLKHSDFQINHTLIFCTTSPFSWNKPRLGQYLRVTFGSYSGSTFCSPVTHDGLPVIQPTTSRYRRFLRKVHNTHLKIVKNSGNLRVPDGEEQWLTGAAETSGARQVLEHDSGRTTPQADELIRIWKSIFSFVLGNRIVHLYKYKQLHYHTLITTKDKLKWYYLLD